VSGLVERPSAFIDLLQFSLEQRFGVI